MINCGSQVRRKNPIASFSIVAPIDDFTPPPEPDVAEEGGDTLEDYLDEEGAAAQTADSDVSTDVEVTKKDLTEKQEKKYPNYDPAFAPRAVAEDSYGHQLDEFGMFTIPGV